MGQGVTGARRQRASSRNNKHTTNACSEQEEAEGEDAASVGIPDSEVRPLRLGNRVRNQAFLPVPGCKPILLVMR